MKIGIMFGDNDFGRSVTKFLEILEEGVANHHNRGKSLEERYTKERILKAYNTSITGIYWLYQNGFCYQTDSDMKDHLHIKLNDIYLNEEVDTQLKEDNNDEFHYIDIKDN